jgi:hypothetical protein
MIFNLSSEEKEILFKSFNPIKQSLIKPQRKILKSSFVVELFSNNRLTIATEFPFLNIRKWYEDISGERKASGHGITIYPNDAEGFFNF